MQVSTDVLIWNDAHMISRAKIHHIAVWSGKFVKFNFLTVSLRFSSILATKFGRSLTPEDYGFVMSSSFDCNRVSRCLDRKSQLCELQRFHCCAIQREKPSGLENWPHTWSVLENSTRLWTARLRQQTDGFFTIWWSRRTKVATTQRWLRWWEDSETIPNRISSSHLSCVKEPLV